MDSKKILNLVTIVMFVITVVLLGLFMFGGEVPNQPYTTPVYTSTLLNWAYILCGIAIIAAIIFPVIRLFTRPKQAMKSFFNCLTSMFLLFICSWRLDHQYASLLGQHDRLYGPFQPRKWKC